MYATNVRELKKNPSLALRKAEESPVLILKGNEPNAVLVHINDSLDAATNGLRPALAATLYRDSVISLGKAAKISGMPLTEFTEHLSSLDIDIVRFDETHSNEAKDISAWLSS